MIRSLTRRWKTRPSAHDVVEAYRFFGNLQPDRAWLAAARGAPPLRAQVHGRCRIVELKMLCHRLLALPVERLQGAEASVGLAFADKPLGIVAIDLPLVALAIGG